jgi:putative tryptophan/tyrosine transport system substrate-binding protein
VKRRELLALLGGGVTMAWTFVARAQHRSMPVIGFLSPGLAVPGRSIVAAFHEGLGEAGYIEGQNVTIEYRGAEGSYNRLPVLAADLVNPNNSPGRLRGLAGGR